MSYENTLGRTELLKDTQEEAYAISERLNYQGLDATVSFHEESGQFIVSVPKEQTREAWKYLEQWWLNDTSAEDDAKYRESVLKHSPPVIPSEEKFRYSTNSSRIFLFAGILVMVLAVINFVLVLFAHSRETISSCIVELLLGFLFTAFGFNSQQKVRMLESQIEEENSFTNQIVNWCTTVYSAEHIDKCIDAASDSQTVTEEERFFLRRQLIQDYILREYDVPDSAYLDFLTDLIYKKFYHPNAVAAS